jgi:hypothetical protein
MADMSSSALARVSTEGAFQLVEVDASFSLEFRAAKKPAGVGVALSGMGKGAMVIVSCTTAISSPLALRQMTMWSTMEVNVG